MAGVGRLMFSTVKPLRNFNFPSSSYHNSSNSSFLTMPRCFSTHDNKNHNQRKLSVVALKASVTSESVIPRNITGTALITLSRPEVKRKSWRLNAEMLLEKVLIDCRFFTLFAVAGSLLGSILCFLEGCFLILESYLNYFNKMLQNLDQGHVVELLIEALDMYLLGSAMLIFGTGLYAFFVGSKDMKRGSTRLISESNFFGLFDHFHMLPAWMEMQSVSKENSKLGHAVLMILQVGILEKFKNISFVTGFDLACFAGAVLVSSASIFLLSRLSMVEQKVGGS